MAALAPGCQLQQTDNIDQGNPMREAKPRSTHFFAALAAACALSAWATDVHALGVQLSTQNCAGQASLSDLPDDGQAHMRCDGQYTLAHGTLTSTQPLLIEGTASLDLQDVHIVAPAITLRSAGAITLGAGVNLDAAQVSVTTLDGATNGTLTVAPGVTIAGQSSGFAVRVAEPGTVSVALQPAPVGQPVVVPSAGGTVSLQTGTSLVVEAAPAATAASGASEAEAATTGTSASSGTGTSNSTATATPSEDHASGGGAVAGWGVMALAAWLAGVWVTRRR